jgi:hypothetical protein
MRTIHSIGIAALAAVALAACGGSDKAATVTTLSPTTTVSSTTLGSAATTSVTTTASNATTAKSTTTKVNANTATQAELQAAFQAAGVSNPAQWAREVTEYRPYTADDTNWGKLRKELAKYNIAADVLEKIIATLTV